MKNNQIVEAVQVAVHLSDKKIKKREIEGLLEAMKAYNLKEGIIITENDEEQIKVENYKIQVIPIWKWLLS